MRIRPLFTCLAGIAAISHVYSNENVLMNPEFDEYQTFGPGDYSIGWVAQSEAPGADELPEDWVSVVNASDNGLAVEIKGSRFSRYLFQDVNLDPSRPSRFILRCVVKGDGEAQVSVLPRTRSDGGFTKSEILAFPLSGEFEEHELMFDIPEDAVIARVFLAPKTENTTVIFDVVELIPDFAE